MKQSPQIGWMAERDFRIEARHLIDFASDGMPAVLSTPGLIGLLERTAREALAPWLEPGENTVGTEIDLCHLAPTPPGQMVHCLARVIHVEGPRITFQLEARDEYELIARGVHKRQVIRMDRLAKTVAVKTTPLSRTA